MAEHWLIYSDAVECGDTDGDNDWLYGIAVYGDARRGHDGLVGKMGAKRERRDKPYGDASGKQSVHLLGHAGRCRYVERQTDAIRLENVEPHIRRHEAAASGVRPGVQGADRARGKAGDNRLRVQGQAGLQADDQEV